MSDRDNENYQLIKHNLDVLRVLVEEAELWVKRAAVGGDTESKVGSMCSSHIVWCSNLI